MIEETLTTLLKAVTPKVYPEQAPDNAAAPFLVYTRVSTPREVTLEGPAAIAYPMFQVDCYHSTSKAAATLAGQVRVALNGYSGDEIMYCNLINQRSLSDISEDPELRRVSLDFRITHTE